MAAPTFTSTSVEDSVRAEPTMEHVVRPEATTEDGARDVARTEATMEDVVLEAWRELARLGRTECLVCGHDMDAFGHCSACGSQLTGER